MSVFWISLLWIVAASIMGFAISKVFADGLGLSRPLFLVPYVGLTLAFLYGFFAWSGIDLVELFLDNWLAGVLAGLIVGALLIWNVRTQPASREAQGSELAFNLTWLGLVYGMIDGLFLNVMPVLAVWIGFTQMGWMESLGGGLLAGLYGLIASMMVAFFYHLGYPEFRGRSMILVLVGNGLITIAYLLSANPLGAVLAHTVMHVAAVLRGPDTTLQLPPHYSS